MEIQHQQYSMGWRISYTLLSQSKPLINLSPPCVSTFLNNFTAIDTKNNVDFSYEENNKIPRDLEENHPK